VLACKQVHHAAVFMFVFVSPICCVDFAELIRPDSNVPTVCNALLVEKAATATRLTVSVSTKRRHGGKTATLLRAASRK